MSFSFFKKSSSLSFVFDIRDASVSLATVRFEKDKKPEIVLCQNFEFESKDSKDSQKYTSGMIETLDKAVISIKKELMKIGNKESIGTHYFFLGSPWIVSQTKTIKIVKDKNFVIDKKLLDQVLATEETTFEKSIEEQTQEPDWKVLEEKIIQSKINGYKVDNLLGEKASNFTAEFFVSFIPNVIKDKLSSYVDEKIVNDTKRQNNSCILSSYSFFRDLYSNKNDFIYVDIGKLITDVYVVRDDIIFGIASFPFGEENIVQTSVSATNLSRDVFMSHINIGQDNNFTLPSHNNGEDLLKTGFDLWENSLRDSLSKICNEMNIPNNMFVISNSVISKILVNEFTDKEKNKKFEMLSSKIEVSDISEGVINSFVSNGQNFPNEPFVKMDLVFLDKMLK